MRCWKPAFWFWFWFSQAEEGPLTHCPHGGGRQGHRCHGRRPGLGIKQLRASRTAAEGGRPSRGGAGPPGLSTLAGWGLLSDSGRAEKVLRSQHPEPAGRKGLGLIRNGNRQDAPEGEVGASRSA